MSKSFRGISTRHFMSPRDRSALSRDYCANCVDLMVLSYTRILNGTKHLLTGKIPVGHLVVTNWKHVSRNNSAPKFYNYILQINLK